jgi:LSD1 subclass zinc finger protein
VPYEKNVWHFFFGSTIQQQTNNTTPYMSNELNEKTAEVDQGKVKCHDCGAFLTFAPGTTHLNCQYCGAKNEIKTEKAEAVEIDFEKFLSQASHAQEEQQVSTVKCDGCGASTTMAPNVTSDNCPFCATPLVIKNGTTRSLIRPKYMLPFKVDRKKADGLFVSWVKGLWWAPNDLKHYASQTSEKLNGMYMPYWTYDSNTASHYTGMRGDYYYDTETYTDSEGKAQTRRVQKTRWTPASGHVSRSFDDVLVCASKALPDKMTRELEPWDLPELVNYNDSFLSGFKTESYQVEVKEGFDVAKKVMDKEIRNDVTKDIGGDTQTITSVDTDYKDITFKHILLPIWISAYRYNDKVYRFTINARTGEVQGERPYSAMKIALAVIGVLAVVAVGVWFFKFRGH